MEADIIYDILANSWNFWMMLMAELMTVALRHQRKKFSPALPVCGLTDE